MRERLFSRWRALLALQVLAIVLLLVPICWQLYCLYLYHVTRSVNTPAHFGNGPANIRTASSGTQDGQDLRFVVAGDSRGYGTFEVLMEEIKILKPEFIVLVGDIARRGTKGDHLFLQLEMATEMITDCPVFYVVGNHDIGPAFPISTWEQAYGPSQFSFMRGGNLFIVAHIPLDPDQAAKGMQFLEEELQAKSAGAHRVFVFNHIPPDFSMGWKNEPLPQQGKFLALLDHYGVDYLISGHYHGYASVNVGKLRIIVTGGGGADLKGGSLGFHHALLMTLRNDTVEERLCSVPAIFALEDRVESEAIATAIPFIRQHKLLVGGVNVFILLLLFVLTRRVVRAVRR